MTKLLLNLKGEVMCERFSIEYVPDSIGSGPIEEGILSKYQLCSKIEFYKKFNGVSFNKGMYRVHDLSEIEMWNKITTEAFPQYEGRVVCFGSDWLGNQFALDEARKKQGEPLVLLFEIGTGEVLKIPCTFEQFHDSELVEFADSALAADFYKTWIDAGNKPPDRKQCIGYVQPLFLGGEDEIDNLQVTDMEVYWHITGQLVAKAKSAAIGTKIDISKDVGS